MLLLITTTGVIIILVYKVRTTTFVPAHEILVWDKRSTVWPEPLSTSILCVFEHLHPYFVCSSIEGLTSLHFCSDSPEPLLLDNATL